MFTVIDDFQQWLSRIVRRGEPAHDGEPSMEGAR
jgi:hypothetical protein